jgi:hypothetical protein
MDDSIDLGKFARVPWYCKRTIKKRKELALCILNIVALTSFHCPQSLRLHVLQQFQCFFNPLFKPQSLPIQFPDTDAVSLVSIISLAPSSDIARFGIG